MKAPQDIAASAAGITAPAEFSTPKASGYMVSPLYDSIFFIGSPLIALAIGLGLGYIWFPALLNPKYAIKGGEDWIILFIAVWTYSHLCAVVFRSHVNQKIYAQFRYRFTVVPIVLFICFLISDKMLVTGFVVTVYWDIYHTSMQNFGFCRIYDAKLGNPPDKGRGLDMMINHFLYIGPIFAGASFVTTLKFVERFATVGWYEPIHAANILILMQPHLQTLVTATGAVLLVYYIHRYLQSRAEGYRFSPQKLCLLISVGITSVWAWVFLSPFLAFFVVNFFHALQYFAIVWAKEKKNIRQVVRIPDKANGSALTFVLYVAVLIAAGLAYNFESRLNIRWTGAFFMVVALMHFWYDSFIWSVRKKEVI